MKEIASIDCKNVVSFTKIAYAKSNKMGIKSL